MTSKISAPPPPIEGKLYFGDNLEILRNKINTESIDLIYLDPPFNSKTDYNILFKTPDNIDSPSQIMAFEDTWHWTNESEMAYGQLLGASGRIASVIKGMREAIGENDMMAYLVMMSIRLIELHRVLKNTGSLYLHCDPTASHYLKVVLDAIFEPTNFRNEVIWHYRKWSAGWQQFQRNHDVILFYSKSRDKERIFNKMYMERAASTQKRFGNKKIISGYDKNGKRIPSKMEDVESKGVAMDDVWEIGRVPPIKQLFPTQKPTALLERIIKASSNKGDIVLDPFCGCGTSIHASQMLHRNWIGIDITHLAIGLIEKRMKDAFGIKVTVEGTPTTFESAQDLAKRNKFQFEAWAVTLIPNVLPNKKQVGDKGVDGRGYISLGKDKNGKRIDAKIIVSVKGGDSLTPSMVRDLIGTINNEKAELGVFISLREPTRKMREAAITAGYFETPLGEKYQKLQIYTISDFFNGVIPKLPSMIDFVTGIQEKTSKQGTQTILSSGD